VLNEQAKKSLLRKIPHGVYVCGVREGDTLNGFTASWVMQGSFTPPLVVNCVRADSASNAMIRNSGVFALSLLEAGQKELAGKFFKPQAAVGGRLADVEYLAAPETGCPALTDTLGYLECRLIGSVDQGDHTVFVGEVVGAEVFREGEALTLESTGWNYGG
jgi:flavin reductase (DIM6/NTAB) family NADH-FMN oxidoreductase RutF